MSVESPAVASAIPVARPRRNLGRRFTLRAKGALAFVGIVLYLAAVMVVTNREHRTHEHYVIDIEQVAAREAAVARLSDAVDHSERVLHDALYQENPAEWPVRMITPRVESVRAALAELSAEFPAFEDDRRGLEVGAANLLASPSREALLQLWEIEQGIEDKVEVVSQALVARRAALKAEYLDAHARVSRIALAHVALGALLFGVVIFGFLHRLTRDIRATEALAVQVARGYRGALPPVTRGDELGRMMQSIADMQATLHEQERKSQLARELGFHQEKMAAVGWMAAAVAHEINNPIAAIAGIAREMVEQEPDGAPSSDTTFGGPRMILAQTERITAISRQIAEFTAPPVTEPALFDLNALVHTTCTFVGYDRRLRGVRLELDLDPALPATYGVADHVTQVLMNLVINAADALEGIAGRAPVIRIATRQEGDWAVLTVDDNGQGMDAAVQSRAFDEMFTTKPAGHGRGLGLFLCRSLVERDGGHIDLTSTPGVGTTLRVQLPLQAPAG